MVKLEVVLVSVDEVSVALALLLEDNRIVFFGFLYKTGAIIF